MSAFASAREPARAYRPVGTVGTHRPTTTEDGNPAATVTTTYTPAEVADTHLVVDMQATSKRYDGAETVNPLEKLRSDRRVGLPAGQTAETFGKSPAGERGAETVTVGGGKFEATWLKTRGANEAGEVFSQTWSSETAPGRLVKSVTTTPAVKKRTVIELVSVSRGK